MKARSVLIVGGGFYGAVCARELTDAGLTCHVIEKREHIGGNAWTRYSAEAACHEHVYGPHIFHTNSKNLWQYINRFADFNGFVNRPRVRHGDRLFSFPINLLTLYQLFGVSTPADAVAALASKRLPGQDESNVEGWCLANLGEELYTTFIKGYTQKQWNRDPRDLPAAIIKRVPVRLTFDDNYYRDRYQGIPVGGYTQIFERLLDGIRVDLRTDFLAGRDWWMSHYPLVIYTGPIDAYFDYEFGPLEYRSLRFERELLPVDDYQGCAVVNYTDGNIPYTRIVEHKHFEKPSVTGHTLISREYPANWRPGGEAYYPVNTPENMSRLAAYQQRVKELEGRVLFGGRLAEYRYYDMHQAIAAALQTVGRLLGRANVADDIAA